MAEINGEEKRIGVSGEQIEEAVSKMPTVEADVKANKQNISALQTASSKHTEDIEKNTADIEKKANADDVYSREETDNAITAKVAEIVAGAPKEFDTLKEMSDWLTEHSDSAATMNTAIQTNTKAIEENTTDIEQNKSGISSIRTDVNDIIPKLSTVSVTSNAENNWYRVFQANQKQTARSGIIMINRAYSNLAPESYTLFFNFAHSNNVFRLITKKVENHKIDKIRLVYKKTSQQEYPCYIDIRYTGTKLNQINVSMHCEAAALTGTGSTFKNRKFVKSDFSVAEIPEGYTSYEFDLAGGDIFDRLEALETALTQTTTVSE